MSELGRPQRRKVGQWQRIALLGVTLSLGLSMLVAPVLVRHFRAMQLLLALSEPETSPARAQPPRVLHRNGTAYRVYGPAPDDARQTLIIVHGIHHLGMDDPRLVRFAQELAAQDYRVVTPQLMALTRYQIDSETVSELGALVTSVADGGAQVGLIGFSFAGSMALLCARDARVSTHLKYVASIGGFHDLERTLRFLITDVVSTPHGAVPRRAHPYGALIVLLDQLDTFDLGDDLPLVKQALVHYLQEKKSLALEEADAFRTESAKILFEAIVSGHTDRYSSKLISELGKQRERLLRLSPRTKLGQLHPKVILLHGSSDNVIPPEETWFASEELRRAGRPHVSLVSPLLAHANLHQEATYFETLRLVHALAELL